MRGRSALRFVTALAGISTAALAVGVGCSTFGTEEPVPSEAGPTADATTDNASPAIDGAPRPFCQSTDAAFCADFEQGQLELGFKVNPIVGQGRLDLEPLEAGALPGHALHATAYPLDAGEDAEDNAHGALLVKALTREGAQGVRIEVDVRPDAIPPGSFVAFAGLATDEGSAAESSVLVSFESKDGYVLVARGKPGTSADRYSFPLPPPRGWMHVRLDVDLERAKITLYTDGTAVFANANGIGGSSIAVSATLGIITLPVATKGVASLALDNFTLQRF